VGRQSRNGRAELSTKMISEELYSTYDLYKKDTKTIATYLASKGQQCGYELEIFREKILEPLGGTNKKKLGHHHKTVAMGSASTASKKTYIIPVASFRPLAHHIAGYDTPAVQIPRSFLLILERTISARRECNKYFRRHSKDLAEENDKHAYFIGVLENVREILRPRVTVEKPKPAPLPQPLRSEDESTHLSSFLTNANLDTQFAKLQVEYTSNEYLNMPDFSPASEDSEIIEYEFEDVEDDEELFFATNCLFKDVQKIRDLLRILWTKYKTGDLDLLSISIMTTAAVDQVRKLEAEFRAEFANMADYEILARRFYARECQSKNPESSFHDPVHARCYDVASWLLFSTCTMIRNFVDKVGPTGFGYPPTYDEYLKFPHRDEETDKESFDADEQVLFGVLPEFCTIARNTGLLLCEDELTRGLRDVFRGGPIALWLVFAAQIFIDAHHILGNTIGDGFAELQNQAQHMMRNVQEHFTFHKDIEANWLEDVDQYLRTTVLLQMNNSVFQDVIGLTFMKVTGPEVPQPPQFHLLKRHPLLCGLTIYLIRSQLHLISVPFLSISGSATTTAHLYNAVSNEGYSSRAWDDMAQFIQLHDVFKGVVPGKGSYLSRFFFAVEGKPSKIAHDRRKVKGRPKIVSGYAAALSEISPVLEVFKHRYEHDNSRPPVSQQTHTEKHRIVEETWTKLQPFLNEQWAIHIDSTDAQALTKTTRGKEKATQKRSEPQTALELLMALQLSLNKELPELLFDYLGFHRTCWELLRKLKADLDPLLSKHFAEGFLADETGLWMLPGYILMTADGSGKLRKKIKLREMKKGVPLTMEVLEGAGKVIDEFLGS
jgi:hypothetical protein